MSLWVTITSALLVAAAVLLVGYPLLVEPTDSAELAISDEELDEIERQIARKLRERREGETH